MLEPRAKGRCVVTIVESLPAYASAEAVARRKGDNLISLLNAYLAGYASGGMGARETDAPVDADGYPVFDIDESQCDIVRPKTDAGTGKHVWPEGFIDD